MKKLKGNEQVILVSLKDDDLLTTEIIKKTKITQGKVSLHLRKLESFGFIEIKKAMMKGVHKRTNIIRLTHMGKFLAEILGGL